MAISQWTLNNVFVVSFEPLGPLHLTSICAWIKYALAIFDCFFFFFITYHIMDSLKFLHKIYGIISANHSCCMQYAYLIFTDSIYEKLLPNLAPMFALFMYCFLDAHQFHFYQASDIITAGDFVITVFFSFCEVFVCNLLTGLKMAETLPLMNLGVQIKFIGSGFYWFFIKYKVFLQKKADTRITIIPYVLMVPVL